jgi:transcription antitermination factor NusG
VLEGPFEGLGAVVEQAEDSRVRGLVELFGRLTPVEFEPEQLEAAA